MKDKIKRSSAGNDFDFESDNSAESRELYRLLLLSGVSEEELALHTGHRARLRMLIELNGMEKVPPRLVLEFLLCFAIPRQDVAQIVRSLLDRFENLNALFSAGADELAAVNGMSRNSADWLLSVFLCSQLVKQDLNAMPLRLVNYRDALYMLPQLMQRFPDASILQICVDAYGFVLHIEPYSCAEGWLMESMLSEAIKSGISNRACRMLFFTFRRKYGKPDLFAVAKINMIADVMYRSNGLMADSIMVSRDGLFSMRQNLMLQEGEYTPRQQRMLEDYISGMPEPGKPLVIMPYTEEERNRIHESD